MVGTGRAHTRNPQGEGGRLRQAILDAASSILERTGSDDAVTLRAVAREAGITAPAIYAHFADRDELKFTVIADTFAEIAGSLRAAASTQAEPVARLRTLCHAYLDFAAERPHHYRVLFERHRRITGTSPDFAPVDVQTMVGADAFGVLRDATAACIGAGASTATDPTVAATRIWIGLHGQATLQASMPWFPWPDRTELADEIMTRLADLA